MLQIYECMLWWAAAMEFLCEQNQNDAADFSFCYDLICCGGFIWSVCLPADRFHEGRSGRFFPKFGHPAFAATLDETWPQFDDEPGVTLQQAALALYWVIAFLLRLQPVIIVISFVRMSINKLLQATTFHLFSPLFCRDVLENLCALYCVIYFFKCTGS